MVRVSKIDKNEFIKAVRINFGTAVGGADVDFVGVVEEGIQQLGPVNFDTENIDISGGRKHIVMIIGVHQDRKRLLADTIDAGTLPALFLSLRQGWQEQRRQNGDD